MAVRRGFAVLLCVVACGDSAGGNDDFADATGASESTAQTGGSTAASATSQATSTTATSGLDSSGDGAKFDVMSQDGGPPMRRQCTVVDDMDGLPPCEQTAPPDSFEPDVQWEATFSDDGEPNSAVTPLVANLTDDDGNGVVDLCDVPDVVVVAYSGGGEIDMGGHLYVLDGATGTLHYRVEDEVVRSVTPAIGDVDGDGEPEIIATRKIAGQLESGPILAIDGRTGAIEWEGPPGWTVQYGGALSLADLDADGDVEIIGGSSVADHTGALVAMGAASQSYSASTAADLDDDGDLEIVLPDRAYHHDGLLLWQAPGLDPAGYPQVANLDGDDDPEILVTGANGLSLLEHDGGVLYQDLRPTGVAAGGNNWRRPATVHDFDGDGAAEYAMSSQVYYSVFEADASVVWSADVLDGSGVAAGTAFDFLGDGNAEAMYADEYELFVFDATGAPLLTTPRRSWTAIEYPVVADIDDDGSAEILVVSNDSWSGMNTAPTVQAIRDVEDRWVPTRRIWNQHTYHVTNVREDGTIPQDEPRSWLLTNTFRTNVQSEAGGVCEPAG
jgi:hypothetical protein